MDPTDVCPNCGIFILRSEDHRCSSNEDVSKRFDDNTESTSILDNTVKESKTYEELPSKLGKRGDFSSSDNEEFQENTFNKANDEYELKNLNLLKKNPLISERNSMSPINEEGFIEESPEVACESNRILAENLEIVGGFFSIDTFLYSGEPVSIVSQYGNLLDGLPFEHLVIDESSDLDQSKHKYGVARRQSIRHDATMAKNSRVAKSKRDCRGSFPPSLQNASEGASVALPCDNQSSPSKINRSRHSRSKSKKSPLKPSSQKSHRYGKSAITCSAQMSDEALMVLHDHQYESEGASSTLASGRGACQSGPDHSESSRAESKTLPLRHSLEKSHHYGKSTMTTSAQKSDEALKVLHDTQYESEEASSTLPSGRQTYKSKPDHIERSRHSKSKSKKSPLKPLSQKSHRYGKSTITCSAQMSDEALMVLHDHQYESEGASSALPSGRQACQSGPDHSESSTSESQTTSEKPSPEKSFSCDQCGMIYLDRKRLENHMILRHNQYGSKGTEPGGSQDCTSRPAQSRRSEPEASTSPSNQSPQKKSFRCGICGAVLTRKRSYETHLFLHSKVKPHVCKDCGKAFATKRYLKVHTRSHTGERRYICGVCGYKFSQRSNLNAHFRVHTGDLDFCCEHCGKKFAFQSLLCNHRRSHTK